MKNQVKKISIALMLFVVYSLLNTVNAQAPDKMSYQAVIRNAGNALIINQEVGMRISILQGTPDGTAVYSEEFTPNPRTNANGLITLSIGTGTPLTGVFNSINWTAGPYFIKSETDPTGGTSYTIDATSELMSVPYALHSNTANKAVYAESLSSMPPLAIGQSYQGGIIFWIDATGQHGLIAPVFDQSSGRPWYNTIHRYVGTASDGLYAGEMNTAIEVAALIADNQTGLFAARICADYDITVDGITYGDWYLPSKYELNLLYMNKNVLENFANDMYWSSTEDAEFSAWLQDFTDGYQGTTNKFYSLRIRAIRAF